MAEECRRPSVSYPRTTAFFSSRVEAMITVDYPEEFKEFKFHMMGTNEIKDVASDAVFDAASSPVIEEGDANESFTEKLLSEREGRRRGGTVVGRQTLQ